MIPFSARTQEALPQIRKESDRWSDGYLGTGHFLAGLIHYLRADLGGALMEQSGKNIEAIRTQARVQSNADQDWRSPADALPKRGDDFYSHGMEKVLLRAEVEAQILGQEIEPEHILLALLEEEEEVAARTLRHLDFDLPWARAKVSQAIDRTLAQVGGTTPSPTAGIPRPAAKTKSDTPELDKYSRDLTEAARRGELDPMIGRQDVLKRVVQTLSRRTKNNPVLVGEPGVGKTAIVEGLAQAIAKREVPDWLLDKRVVSLDLAAMVAGTQYRGMFEERLTKALNDIEKAGNIITFIDELHTVVGAGSAEGSLDASNILKPRLARGLRAIGATTPTEYRKYVEKDAALERRFQSVDTPPLNSEETIATLKGLRRKFETHHHVTITDEAILTVVRHSDQHIPNRFQPDKSIDLLDEACARARLATLETPPHILSLEAELAAIKKRKEEALELHEVENAIASRREEKAAQKKVEEETAKWLSTRNKENILIAGDHVASVTSEWTGVPLSTLNQTELEKVMGIAESLNKKVVAQGEATEAVAKAIKRSRAGLKNPKQPIGSFLFLGPTGVGKTETARALAYHLFGDENAIVRFDMSEYSDKESKNRLIGSAPGYVGYNEGGQLTEKIHRRPYCVLLFDEIEKAHPSVHDLLLQVTEDGRLTDGKGRTVEFKNTVIIMTSNAGAQAAAVKTPFGFGDREAEVANAKATKKRRLTEVKKTFRPEFLNRLKLIFFNNLTKQDMPEIVALRVADVPKFLKQNRGTELTLQPTPEAIQFLVEKGFDKEYGARPLKAAVEEHIQDPLSDEVLIGSLEDGQVIKLDVKDDKIVFTPVEPPKAAKPADLGIASFQAKPRDPALSTLGQDMATAGRSSGSEDPIKAAEHDLGKK